MGASAQPQPKYSPPGRLATWVRQSVESFVAAQKILLDLTAQQNALAIGILRERVNIPNPAGMLVKIADQSVDGLTGAGKILLDLAAGETAVVVDGMKDVMRLGPTAGTVADVIRHRAETLIEMHRKLLDAVAEQMHTIAESYEEGKGLMAGTNMAELARRTMEGFVETEKKFLDLVAEEVTAATEGTRDARRPHRDRSKALTQMARDGVEKYIDAQRKLLDLAIEQFEANKKVAKERAEAIRGAREDLRSSFAELTQKSVENFVTAEKSLLNLATKPARERPASAEGRKTARRGPRRKASAAVKNVAAKNATA